MFLNNLLPPLPSSFPPAAGTESRAARLLAHPTHYTLHTTHYTPHPTPYTLHPTPYTPHPTPYTPHPAPFTLHPTTHTLHPTPYTLHLTPYTLHPTPYTPLRRRTASSWSVRTRHTLEPLPWYWSHWHGRSVNRARGTCLFSWSVPASLPGTHTSSPFEKVFLVFLLRFPP